MSSTAASHLLRKDRLALCEKILSAKRSQKLTWNGIAESLGLSPVYVASVCLGQNSIKPESGVKLLQLLKIENAEDNALTLAEPPIRSQESPELYRDPFLTRLQEINNTYGIALKEIVQEKFGDGIMSAIDFNVSVDKIEDPVNGDRVQLTMSGKFLPFKSW